MSSLNVPAPCDCSGQVMLLPKKKKCHDLSFNLALAMLKRLINSHLVKEMISSKAEATRSNNQQ